MANQPSWPPFQPQKDCSQPFCTIYCPQWCYSPLSSPPTFDPFDSTPFPFSVPLLNSNSNTGLAFSPANIAIIAIVGTIFFFAAYFILLHKCHRRQRHLELPTTIISTVDAIERNPGSTPKGLDQSLINRIATFKFRKGASRIIKGTSCSVCLSEFCEGEILRILPKCSHVFHMRCIDTWLRSRPSCPLCRAGIVWVGPPPPVMARESEGGQSMEVDRQDSLVTNDDYGSVSKDSLEGRGMRRSSSVDFLSRRGDSGEDRSAASSSMGDSSERTVLSMRPGSMVRSLSCGR